MSVILRQLEEMKAALTATAQWEDLVSVEEIAKKTHKSIQSVKELLAEKGLKHKAKFGKCYLYSEKGTVKCYHDPRLIKKAL